MSPGTTETLRTILAVLLLAVIAAGLIPVVSTAVQFVLVALHSRVNHYRKAAPFFPRVVVLIPAWNEGAVVGASIDRLMQLEYPREALRIYVVDDASTDDTPHVVRDRERLYPGSVRHLRRENGGEGKAHTLNHGLRTALEDDWMQAVLVMDADVIYERDALRKMTRHLADPAVGAVTAYIREGSRDKNYLTRFIAFEYVLGQLAARRAQNVVSAMACLAGGAQLHSRANLEALGGLIDTDTLAEDTITTFETQLHGRRAVFEPHAVVLAEEPQGVDALWRQRLRWARGNLQVTRRYRWLWFRHGKHPGLGRATFALQWFSILVLPLVMVVVPLAFLGLFALDHPLAQVAFRALWISAACLYLFAVVFSLQLDPVVARASWWQALLFPGLLSVAVMVTAFFPGLLEERLPGVFGLQLTPAGHVIWTVVVYLWVSLAMVGAWIARLIEPTRVGRFLTPVLVYLVGYGPLQCAVAVDAFYREIRGASTAWEKTEKIGRVLG
ncbi:glycosyltransferase [Cellulomonas fimi]|uniref:glycosyltransferase family 2 protein n=1 Tax=Cellulomonas sp. RIT-PI-Y TaxID=3035297 RepID=UPI0021DB6A60